MFNSSSSNQESWSDFNGRFGKEGRKSKILSNLMGGGGSRTTPGKHGPPARGLPRGMSGKDLMRASTGGCSTTEALNQPRRGMLARAKSVGGHKTKIGSNTSNQHSVLSQAA